MVLIHSYTQAVFFSLVSMICWGSWANTQKLAAKNWRFELFYWDAVLGLLLFSLLAAFTLGSFGAEPGGRTFLEDIQQADLQSIGYAVLGGVFWNIGDFLIIAAISLTGLAIGFPIGAGLSWLGGTIIGYITEINMTGGSSINPVLLFSGMALGITAIYLDMVAYRRLTSQRKGSSIKGIILAVLGGLSIAPFFTVTMYGIDPAFGLSGTGTLTPYSGVVCFALGAFLSTFVINPIFMAQPVAGAPVKIAEYFKGTLTSHLWGILGGSIWMLGFIMSFISGGQAPTIAYALSNAAPS